MLMKNLLLAILLVIPLGAAAQQVNIGPNAPCAAFGTATGTCLQGGTGNVPAVSVASGALANGMTATTQSAGDNSTKVATTAYVATAITAASAIPTQQKLTSGTSATYTTPASVRQLRIRMIGGGGGGGAAADGSTAAGSAGGTTTFNSINAVGGAGAPGGLGGYASTPGTGTANLRVIGNGGGPGYANGSVSASYGGFGGGSFFGGGTVANATGVQPGVSAQANSGAGGSGGSNANAVVTEAGGGQAGEYVELIINSPAGTYTYTIGAGGVAGSGGGAQTGGTGGSGLIVVDEYY